MRAPSASPCRCRKSRPSTMPAAPSRPLPLNSNCNNHALARISRRQGNPSRRSPMSLELPEVPRPAHVPASLVRPFPFIFGTTTDRDPFGELAAAVHQGPEVFYAEHAYPGGTPAWIVRRAEDLRQMYFDTEHFTSNGFSPFSMLIGEKWNLMPAEIDPPDHGVYRALVSPLFK